ncbi:hypothetical protein ACFTAO_01865 [Paenibacillus rhizoplanae]
MIAYYTSFNPNKSNGNQKIGAAYSKDKGRTWVYYGDDAIVPNPGGINGSWDFRDPKVVRDDVNNRWIMVVSGGDHIRFYTSTDLLHWTWTDNFGYSQYIRGGVWECPDLFQLAVDGNANNKKMGADDQYRRQPEYARFVGGIFHWSGNGGWKNS